MSSPKFIKGDRVILINDLIKDSYYNILKIGYEGTVVHDDVHVTLVQWDKYIGSDLNVYSKDLEKSEVVNSPLYKALT